MRTMDKVHKPSNTDCYASLPEPPQKLGFTESLKKFVVFMKPKFNYRV
jgi:hypothetical protein